MTVLLVTGAVIGAVWIGAATLLPPWLRGTVERIASRSLGRELKIAGPFDVSLSLAPRLTAGDVRLANAPWGSEPSMIRVGRVTLVVDLLSLWSGPARVRDLAIEDARVLLETDAGGQGNWMLAPEPSPERPSESAKRPPLVIEHASIRGFELILRKGTESQPVLLSVNALEGSLDPATAMVDVRGAGQFKEAQWEISAQVGSLDRLYEGHDVDLALGVRIGESRLEARGRMGDPLSLGAPDLHVSAEGPDLVEAMRIVGLQSPASGAFQLRARLTPEREGVAADVTAAVGAVTARANGELSALLAPDRLHFTVDAAGPDASVPGSWFGVRGVPPRAFKLSGQVRREGGRFHLDGVKARVGPTELSVTGIIGAPPRFVGTDLALRAKGKDLSRLSKLAHLRLPSGSFEVGGQLLRRANGLAIGAAELRVEGAVIRAGGRLGEPPGLATLDLTLDAAGPDLAVFSRLASVDLPHAPFAIRGRIARDGRALVLDGVQAQLGDTIGSVSGRLVFAKRLEGTVARLRVAGPSSATLASHLGLRGVPSEPFEVTGHVAVKAGGYDLADVVGTVGRVSAAVDGRIGARGGLDATALSFRVLGPALADLAAWGLPEKLPADPFSVVGRLRIESGIYHADGVVADVGPDRARIDGVLGALPDLSGLDATVSAAGPSLAGIGRFLAAAGLEEPARLPARRYEISGLVRRLPSGYALQGVAAQVGDTQVRVEGTVGSGRALTGTDLRFGMEAPDTSLLSDLAGTPFPNAAFEAHGRLARVDAGLLLDGVSVSIGTAHAEVTGTIGPRPGLGGTELRILASGPDLAAAVGPVLGGARVPAAAFELSADFAGDAEHLATRLLTARLGRSDLEGSLSMRRVGRTVVDADLRSNRLDLAELLAGLGAAPATGVTPAAAAKPSDQKLLLPDDPIRLDELRSIDGTLKLDVAALPVPGLPLRDVVIAGELRDGALRVDRIQATGVHGGRASAGLDLRSSGGGYRVGTRGRLEGVRLVASSSGGSPEEAPSLDVEFRLEGEGRSLHEIAANLDGAVLVVVGEGQISNSHDLIASGVLVGLLDALNPFRESSDHTDFECGVALATLTNGKMGVAPIALRTDRLTVVGHGNIDFETEGVELEWTLKPRRGIGLSPGSIANPYVKLGGTLSSPRLEMKTLEAAASTGAAVATMGLTVLAKGFYDRITAEKDECVRALSKTADAFPERR